MLISSDHIIETTGAQLVKNGLLCFLCYGGMLEVNSQEGWSLFDHSFHPFLCYLSAVF